MTKRLVLLALAASALPLLAADRAPEVTRKGRTVVSYKDATVEAVLSYRWTNANPKATWVPFPFAVSAATGQAVEIAREDVSLVTPKGARIPLPTEKQYLEAPDPRAIIQALKISRDPIAGYFPGRTQTERLRFFTLPSDGISYDRVTVTQNLLAIGLLWFPLPEGVAPGRYRLEIRSKWANADIPFDVPAPPLGKGSDEGVAW